MSGFDNCNGDATDGCETDLTSDSSHCGACGNACGLGESCSSGSCATCAMALVHEDATLTFRDLDVADMDGDGDSDLALAHDEAAAEVYRNDGTDLTRVWTESPTGNCGGVRWGDVDSDGDPDLAVSHCNSPSGGFAHVFRNQSGVLDTSPFWTSESPLWVESLAWGDADGDGVTDLFVGTLPNLGPESRIYRGTGTDLGSTAWWIDSTAHRVPHARIVDLDADEDGDLVIVADPPNGAGIGPEGVHHLRNDGGSYTTVWSFNPVPDDGQQVFALADLDGDGARDIVASDSGGSTLSAFLGDAGSFETEATWSVSTTGVGPGLRLGDVNGDGIPDLALGRGAAPTEVWLGDGTGAFSLWWSSTTSDDSLHVAWADWDGDGRRDELVTGGGGVPLRVYAYTCP